MVVDPVDVGRAVGAVVEQDAAGVEVEELQTAAWAVHTEDPDDPAGPHPLDNSPPTLAPQPRSSDLSHHSSGTFASVSSQTGHSRSAYGLGRNLAGVLRRRALSGRAVPLDLDTGRVLFSDALDAEYCIYRVDLAEATASLAGSFPTAYFDSFDAPRRNNTHQCG